MEHTNCMWSVLYSKHICPRIHTEILAWGGGGGEEEEEIKCVHAGGGVGVLCDIPPQKKKKGRKKGWGLLHFHST